MLRGHLPLLLALSVSCPFAQAQTKPQSPVHAEERAQARAIIAQLLREGKIIRPSQVHRGMRGVARSVFRGTEIEEFPVVVLGVLERVQGGGDLVLIKVLGGTVVQRQSGIVAGMSGSPVYINGKMLGAIALGWGFPKEPIGGVTPVTEMIESSLPDNPKNEGPKNPLPPPATITYLPRTPLQIGGKPLHRIVVARRDVGDLGEGTAQMRPVSTLLQLSGFSQASLPGLRRIYEPYGIEPVIGPASRKTMKSPPLEPGAAIGVQLVSGDMDQTAVGTVTFRWGNRVLAFGHPMFGQGAVSLPISTAFVHEIFPSYQRSFKLASPIAVVGAMQQDTEFAIGGTVGARADTLPMSLTLRDARRQIAKTYNVRVIKDPNLTPQLIGSVAEEAVETSLGQTADRMVRVKLRMELDGAEPIVKTNLLYSGGPVAQAALFDLGQSLALTQMNEFQRGSIRRVELTLDVEDGHRTARIRRISVNRNRIEAGESVSVEVALEPTDDRQNLIKRTFSFQVPKDAPNGDLTIVAAPASSYWPAEVRAGGAPPDPANLKQLVGAWNQVGAINELLVVVSTAKTYLKVDDEKLGNPAPSWTKLLRGAKISNLGVFNEIETRNEATDFMLSGAQILTIPIENKEHPDKKPLTVRPSGDSNTLASPPTPDKPKSDDKKSTDAAMAWWPDLAAPLLYSLGARPAEDGPTLPRREPDDRPITPTLTSPTPTPTPTGTPTPTPTPAPSIPTALPGRSTQSWVQEGPADFLAGDFKNALVTNEGDVSLAPPSQQIISTSAPFVWSVAGDKDGNTYLALGNPAKILKVDRQGQQTVIYESLDVAVTSLAWDDFTGALYAGFTGGRVDRFMRGERTTLLNLGGGFIWALGVKSAPYSTAGLYIATGGTTGALYLVPTPYVAGAEKLVQKITEVPQKHIRSLSFADDASTSMPDDIYLGTGDDGVLYRLDKSRKLSALYQADGDNTEILAVAAAPEGVYFGTSKDGTLYRWNSTTGAKALYPAPQSAIYALQRAANGKIYAATGDKGILYEVTPEAGSDQVTVARVLEAKPAQVLSLALAPNGDLLAGTGNNGSAYRIGLQDKAPGTFTSRVFDAKNVVQWGAVRLQGQGVQLEARSGNTLDPDASWSEWKSAGALSTGEYQVNVPSGRFLQIRATLQQQGEVKPSLSRLETVFRGRNSAPLLKFAAPTGGDWWKGDQKVVWNAVDPDGDALRYKLWISADDGATWKALDLSKPEISMFALDTKKWPDGIYRVKIEATDALANPEQPATTTEISRSFTIDNTPPELSAPVFLPADGGSLVKVTATDATSPVALIDWRYDTDKESDRHSAVPMDGIFDTRQESASALLEAAKTGQKIEIRARDVAGNIATITVTVP